MHKQNGLWTKGKGQTWSMDKLSGILNKGPKTNLVNGQQDKQNRKLNNGQKIILVCRKVKRNFEQWTKDNIGQWTCRTEAWTKSVSGQEEQKFGQWTLDMQYESLDMA